MLKLFLAAASLRPEYGGPARSVSRLAVALAAAGVEVGVWAPDQSAATTPFITEGSRVLRLTGGVVQAVDSFGRPDVLHDNGMWLRHNHQFAILASARRIPRIVSTRGMLEPWAFNHKRFKKRIAWSMYQRRDLKRARCHHTTSEMEAQNLRQFGLDVPVHVIPNGVELADVALTTGCEVRSSRRRTALFLGRIYPVKGLPMLVKAWERLRPADWILKIAGPDEAGHLKEIQGIVDSAALRSVVSFVGPVEGDVKRDLLREADLFVLPSHSESFGMAVVEALAYGVPVITTTATPWSLLVERGCGWYVSPTVEGIEEGLRQATSVRSEGLLAMGRKGREFVAEEFDWNRVASKFLKMYEGVVSPNTRR